MITFNTHNGKLDINPVEIAYCEAQGSYTLICQLNGKKNMVSKNLKTMSDYLPNRDFIRIHSSHIVNKSKIRSYNKFSSQITLINDSVLPVSRRKSSILRSISKDDGLLELVKS